MYEESYQSLSQQQLHLHDFVNVRGKEIGSAMPQPYCTTIHGCKATLEGTYLHIMLTFRLTLPNNPGMNRHVTP